MAADGTYQPGIHRLQGGNTLECSTAGTIDVYGTLTANSGATFANKTTLKNSSAGQIAETVTQNVAAATLVGYGVSSIGSSTAGVRAYKLNRPTAVGAHKYIYLRGSTGASYTIVSATATASACKFNATKTKISFKTAAAKGMSLHLIAASSTNWSIVGHSTAAATYTCT